MVSGWHSSGVGVAASVDVRVVDRPLMSVSVEARSNTTEARFMGACRWAIVQCRGAEDRQGGNLSD